MKTKENPENNDSTPKKSINLIPGIIIVVLQWFIKFVLPTIFPSTATISVLGGLVGGLAVIIWWVFFSRASKTERWIGSLLIIIALAVMSQVSDKSIKTGMQGMMFYVLAMPLVSLAFVIWAGLSRRLQPRLRVITMAATILISAGITTLFRSEGITGNAGIDLAWRWSKTSEEQFLTNASDISKMKHLTPELLKTEPEWPGFRGANRDAIIHGTNINTDWTTNPPEELWRKPVGPGCSSFAVHGNFIFTQEQHGEEEIVSCYNLTTGEPVWIHSDMARFWDSHAGAGPRGTPTLKDGRVYTVGATGLLNVLNELDGSVIWSRNAASDINAELPGWGFASSPLVFNDAVLIAIAGTLLAYNIENGEPKWTGPDGIAGYSSPHLCKIDDVMQVLFMSKVGVNSFSPKNGNLLWKLDWEEERIVQPALISNGELLISAGGIKGLRRVSINHKANNWKVDEQWTTTELKPNFNDIVIHKNYVYGFNGPILTCVDIETGNRVWKGGRYGGQLLLLADQDVLLILTEKGEIALVKTDPREYTELAKIPAIKGKTWNHPALVNNVLLVRNAQEMAAFRLD